MSGITYGEYWARQARAASESSRGLQDLQMQRLKLENEKLKEELLKLKRDNKTIDREQELQSDRWA